MSQPSRAPKPVDEVEIRFERASDYKIVHADGAWGGITPSGSVAIGFYAEYKGEPTSIIYEAKGGSPTEVRRSGPEPLRRELQVNVMMTESVAVALYEWLGTRLAELETLKSQFNVGAIPDEMEDEDVNLGA